MTSTPVLSPTLSLEGEERVERPANLALQVGGALWIAHYALQLAMGFAYGEVKHEGVLGSLDGLCFLGAIFGFSLGLGLLARSLWSRAWTAKAGLVFAALASLGVLGSAVFIMMQRPPGIFGGMGVISSCLAALFVALAARRVQLWSPRRSLLLLLTGALTFPLILLFIIPGMYIPAFLTDELPFALSGAAFIAFARMGQK